MESLTFILIAIGIFRIEAYWTAWYSVIFICFLLLMYKIYAILAIQYSSTNPICINIFLLYTLSLFIYTFISCADLIFLCVKYLVQVLRKIGQTLQ